MAMRFPSQNKLQYQTGAISTAATNGGSGTWHALTSGGVSGHLNLPKDLSLLNMRGYDHTNRKGVPLVYRTKIDFFLHDEDGATVGTAFGSDAQAVLKIDGCQNNWVMRNAAVKWHAAREKMYRDAGVTKRSRGAYAHTIRYGYDAYNDTWLVPVDGDGDAFTAGTWDLSDFAYSEDSSFKLTLVGDGDDEETDAFSGNELQIGHAYLLSRISQQADTNLETEEGPAQFSVLKKLLSPSSNVDLTVEDNVTADARNEQDNPPYEVLDLSDSGDVSHNITEPVELGRAVSGLGNAYGSVIVDIPFGIANIRAKIDQAASFSMTPAGLVCVEVLDIYEMQG